MYNDILQTRNGEDYIGEVKLKELIGVYDTPLICFDQKMIEDNLKLFQTNFRSKKFATDVLYASKAFSVKAMYQLLSRYSFGADFVSGGEIYTALHAGFDLQRGYFHGNNKSESELELAIAHDIGCIVIDNFDELKLVNQICAKLAKKVNVLIRLNPGIVVRTHAYIQTAKLDSKFGMSIFDDQVIDFIKAILASPHLVFKGLHCHIGSQIHHINAHLKTAKVMIEFIAKLKEHGIIVDELNLGGGFGISINKSDQPYNMKELLTLLVKKVESELKKHHLDLQKLIIEPGRSIVSECACTLYRIGAEKTTFAGKSYLFIDGGMSDNLRPSLYQAHYECDILGKVDQEKDHLYTIGGKNCESGDILIHNAHLPHGEVGDILVVYSTGAYTYSMSNNYNRNCRPAVVFIKDDKVKLVVRRETYEDLLNCDLSLEDENEKI